MDGWGVGLRRDWDIASFLLSISVILVRSAWR